MECLSKEVIDFINQNESDIEDNMWDAVLPNAYIMLDNDSAAELYQALTDTLELNLESERETVLAKLIARILRRMGGRASTQNLQADMINYLGMDDDEFFDFIRNYDNEWYCEFEDNDYVLILR